MPRKGAAPKREAIGDVVYNNVMIAKFINRLMLRGKKSLAERIFYQSMDNLQEKTGKESLKVFEQAMENVMPILEVRPRRVGGATYQVPMEVRHERKTSLGMRWILANARKRAGKTIVEKLTAELMDAFQGVGGAVKKKEDTHKMAEANKAFAHYRW